ncbi:hypothetical protein Pcinc_025301 [Petrolisthes cinctipes]|uniref:PABC domain-containing protein n=1 Tax=Petrolisthes cinctipes TaxID=88211 RepID=A0AAE1F895_PETCI|nr:hypothetical protein Pcinc_025301 [Petrolisthes cinctipes]
MFTRHRCKGKRCECHHQLLLQSAAEEKESNIKTTTLPPPRGEMIMEKGLLPETRQVLCQHLHAKVCYLNPALADQVTDVLTAGKTNNEIIHLLTTDSLLEEHVDNTIASLSMCNSEVRECLGSAVFQAVAGLEQELCAQVTGMLLELPGSTLTHLLSHPPSLSQAVAKARAEYMAYIKVDHDQAYKNKERLSGSSVENNVLHQNSTEEASHSGPKNWPELEREEETVRERRRKGGKKERDERYLGFWGGGENERGGGQSGEKDRRERQYPCYRTEGEGGGENERGGGRGGGENERGGGRGGGENDIGEVLSMEKESLGETLYYTLASWYPPHLAPRLTGMLLQMDTNHLLRLVADPTLLKEKVQLALQAIDAHHV